MAPNPLRRLNQQVSLMRALVWGCFRAPAVKPYLFRGLTTFGLPGCCGVLLPNALRGQLRRKPGVAPCRPFLPWPFGPDIRGTADWCCAAGRLPHPFISATKETLHTNPRHVYSRRHKFSGRD